MESRDFTGFVACDLSEVHRSVGNSTSQDDDSYDEYEFSIMSMLTSKNVGLQTLYVHA